MGAPSKDTAAAGEITPEQLFSVANSGTSASHRINDWVFINDLRKLIELRAFLLNEAINVSPQDSAPLSFGSLNLLKYDQNGREPTEEEWSAIETHTQALFQLMTEPLRRRFLLGQIPSWMSILPIVLAAFAVLALIAAIIVQDTGFLWFTGIGISTLPFYLIWLVSLGAIGSVAFVGMNALSVQQDVTFDIANKRLMILRIALGALFGLVLTLPFGFSSFLAFVRQISKGLGAEVTADTISRQAMFLLLPFVLGFSTSLVIMVLNRFVDAVQTFFGKSSQTSHVSVASIPNRASSGTSSLPPPPSRIRS
jgi:hypothetical protein